MAQGFKAQPIPRPTMDEQGWAAASLYGDCAGFYHRHHAHAVRILHNSTGGSLCFPMALFHCYKIHRQQIQPRSSPDYWHVDFVQSVDTVSFWREANMDNS